MSFFGGGSKVNKPNIESTAPRPDEFDAGVTQKSDDTRRKMMAKLGREGTILTALGGTTQMLGTSL